MNMLPKPHTVQDFYSRLYGQGKKIHKDMLIYVLKHADLWYYYWRKRKADYKRDLDEFEYKLANKTLED